MLKFDVADSKKLRVIIDSDTACEADDPFAIAYALMSPKLMVKAIVAEHFAQPGSMELSREAALRVTRAMNSHVPVLRGEEGPGGTGEPSEGVRRIIDEARREDEHPLFVLCMGALTNVSRALREAPDIAGGMTVVTIGGHPYDTEEIPFKEFNFGNDPEAANQVLQSEVPLWQIPSDVYGSIRVGLAELQEQVMPYGAIGQYLFDQMIAYNATPAASWTQGESWSLGDSPAVAAVLHPTCGRTVMQTVRHVNDDTSYSPLPEGRKILVYRDLDSRYLLGDFYAKLHLNEPAGK
jgi:Inosine-uridine nucleoside N-ribohydrolase